MQSLGRVRAADLAEQRSALFHDADTGNTDGPSPRRAHLPASNCQYRRFARLPGAPVIAAILVCGCVASDAQWRPKWNPGFGQRGPEYDAPPPPPVENVEPPPPPQKNADETARAAAAKYAEACSYNRRGLELYNSGKWDLAREAFAAALRLAPNDAVMKRNHQIAKEVCEGFEQRKSDEKKNEEAAVEGRAEILELAREMDFDGRQGGGGLPIRRVSGDANSDPMVVDLRDRLRESIHMDVVSGGRPPAGNAGGLPIRRAGADERPTLADIARRRALAPERQEDQLAKAVAHLQGQQLRIPNGDAGMERTMRMLEEVIDKDMEEMFRPYRREPERRPGFTETLKRIGSQMNDRFNESEGRFFEGVDYTVEMLKVSGEIREGESAWAAMARASSVRKTMFTAVIDGIQKMNNANMVAMVEALEACILEIKEGERR